MSDQPQPDRQVQFFTLLSALAFVACAFTLVEGLIVIMLVSLARAAWGLS